MENQIQKYIYDFVVSFEEFCNTVKTVLKDCHKHAVTWYRLVNRYINIKKADLSQTPLEKHKNLQQRLFATLTYLIYEETIVIEKKLLDLKKLFQNLCIKLNVFVASCGSVDFTQQTPLVEGSLVQQPLKVLLDLSATAIKFGQAITLQIDDILEGLKFDDSIENINPKITDCFKISPHWQRFIESFNELTSNCPSSINELYSKLGTSKVIPDTNCT